MNSDDQQVFYCEYRVYCSICDKLCIERLEIPNSY